MFTSENDRLDAINKSLLALISTIGERDTEIAALKDQLRAKPVHGQELEAEIERLENEARDLRAEIGRLRDNNDTNRVVELRSEVESLTLDNDALRDTAIGLEARVDELRSTVAALREQKVTYQKNANNEFLVLAAENGNLSLEKKELQAKIESLNSEIKHLREQLRTRTDEVRLVGTDDLRCGSEPATDDTSNLREIERINKPAVRKVLAQGRIVSPVRTAARRAMAIEERRLEGKA